MAHEQPDGQGGCSYTRGRGLRWPRLEPFARGRSRAVGARGTATESPSSSSSVSKLVGACTLMSLDELRVRSPLSSNRKPPLTSNRSAVVCRDAPCASPRCCRSQRLSERSASCSSATAQALPRLPWPRGPSTRASAAGSAIAIALFAAAARHACGMRLRGSRGACLAYSHASRC